MKLKPGQKVVNPDEMDDATFLAHFNFRHSDQLAGLSEIPEGIDDETLGLYRTFHDHLHNWLRMDMPHEHREFWEE